MQASKRKVHKGTRVVLWHPVRPELGMPLGHPHQEQKHLTEKETSKINDSQILLFPVFTFRHILKKKKQTQSFITISKICQSFYFQKEKLWIRIGLEGNSCETEMDTYTV